MNLKKAICNFWILFIFIYLYVYLFYFWKCKNVSDVWVCVYASASKYDHNLWLQQKGLVLSPGAVQKLVSCMYVRLRVCVFVRGATGGCLHVKSFFFLLFFWVWFFYLQALVFVCLFVSMLAFLCVYGHVFLMKAHAGQINSQKLRGGGSPSLWNGAYCSL